MRRFFLAVAWLLLLAATQPRPFHRSVYWWKHRLLLVFAPDAREAGRQAVLLQADRDGMRQRDLLLIRAFARWGSVGDGRTLTETYVRRLRKEFGLGPYDFGVVLVGKDGGEKYRWREPVALDTIFAVIDAMPMRRAEMGRGPAEGGP